MKRKVLTIGAVAVVTLSSAFFTDTAVHAQPSLQDINAKQQEVKSKLSKAESEIADILYEMKDISEKVTKLQAELETNEKQLFKIEEEIEQLQEQIDELNEKIEVRNEKLKERLAAYQENGGNIQFIEVILGSKNAIDFISRVDAVTTITNADIKLIEDNERDKAAVEVNLNEQESLFTELEEKAEKIKTQKSELETSIKNLKEKEEKVQKEKSKLQSESSELSALEAEIRASYVAPVVASASGNSGNTSNGAKSSKSSSPAPTIAYTGGGGSAIAAGKSVLGSPYRRAGTSPSGFDCSGFVQWAYKNEGVSLPRTASQMARVGTKVPYSQAKPGDLVIFRGGGHVGIYLGGGKFIGSQSSTGVAIADMNSGYWKNNFDGNVRRIK